MGRFALNQFIDLYLIAKESHGVVLQQALNPTATFNLLCSLNHLMDWAQKDITLASHAHEIADIRNLYDQENHPLWLVRQLCNAHKHFTAYTNTPQTRTVQGYGIGRFGMGGYGVGEPSYKIEVNGTEISFLDLSQEVMSVWDNFVQRNGLN